MNRDHLRKIRADIDEALAAIGTKHKLKLSTIGGLTYGTSSFTVKIEGKVLNAEGVAEKDKTDWRMFCEYSNFLPDDLGKTFESSGGRTYTITGVNSNRSKYPILADRDDGKHFKFTTETVLKALGRT